MNTTANSVVVSWGLPPNSSLPDVYIILTHSLNQTHSVVVQASSTRTRVEFENLVPQQSYRYCVIAVYGPSLLSFCRTFQTQNSSSIATTLAPPHPNHNPSTTLGCNPEPISGGCNSIVMGVLVSIIIVLLFLLLLAVLGLAYPRCIRSKVKDKKHLSKCAITAMLVVVLFFFVTGFRSWFEVRISGYPHFRGSAYV